VSLTLPCRWRMRFSAWRAWPFFDIWISSRSPFLVARVKLAPFARQPGKLRNIIFGALWCGMVRLGHFHPPLAKAGWIGWALMPFETLPPKK